MCVCVFVCVCVCVCVRIHTKRDNLKVEIFALFLFLPFFNFTAIGGGGGGERGGTERAKNGYIYSGHTNLGSRKRTTFQNYVGQDYSFNKNDVKLVLYNKAHV